MENSQEYGMDNYKIPELVICLGSSCFSRGNKSLVKIIKNYLKENGLEAKVKFYGKRCFANCAKGPTIMLDGKILENVNENNIKSILDEFFKLDLLNH